MAAHQWKPIEGIDPQSCKVDFGEIDSLHKQWRDFRKQREEENPGAYTPFLERIGRRWAIETGVIEGIYSIDVGTTQTLVENGLIAGLIDRSSTDRDPQSLVRILEDHRTAAEFVTESIRRKTPFSRLFIRQLHQRLTRNQPTYTAFDQFGNEIEVELDRGGFKMQPNNPTRPDGSIHEYCPPIQVDSEIDNLVRLHGEMQDDAGRHHTLLAAAWLHHRFTQIHPFQDGNGRVARTLLAWQLAKAEYLPIVISRDDRPRYIEVLESADADNLDPFVQFIVRLERRMILEALDEPAPVAESGMVSQILDYISERIRQQKQDRLKDHLIRMRSVNSLASSLQEVAREYLETQASSIEEQLNGSGLNVKCAIDWGGPGNREHWYRSQVVQTAKDAGHWANLYEDRFFIKLSINPDVQSGAPRLIFVVSLHHVGRQVTGIMAATAFVQITNYDDQVTEGSEEPSGPEFQSCAVDSYTFTWEDKPEPVENRFRVWLEAPLGVALRYWSEFIS